MTAKEQTTRRSMSRVKVRRIESLADLDFTQEQWTSLARQGNVTAEYRNGRGPYYKLRFRVQGKQVVRYLGICKNLAAKIAQELEDLQENHHLALRLNRLVKVARISLRDTKQMMLPTVEAAGFHFHGMAIRRCRGSGNVHPET